MRAVSRMPSLSDSASADAINGNLLAHEFTFGEIHRCFIASPRLKFCILESALDLFLSQVAFDFGARRAPAPREACCIYNNQ